MQLTRTKVSEHGNSGGLKRLESEVVLMASETGFSDGGVDGGALLMVIMTAMFVGDRGRSVASS